MRQWQRWGVCLLSVFWLSVSAFAFDAINPKNIEQRDAFLNSRLVFERTSKGHVAFIGGSITEMNGYRPMVCADLQKRFPKTEFTFTDAGISSTCSTTGAFRLQSDVLSKGPVDLFFIEFAVNDDQDAFHATRECVRGLEGILRHCRQRNAKTDIVVTFFVNEGMLAKLQKGDVPVSIAAHSQVCQHYGVSTIHLAREVAERITAEKLTWKQYGGVHPAPFGNRICADMIDQLLSSAWKDPLTEGAMPKPHAVPATPLDANNYSAGRFQSVSSADRGTGWSLSVPNWEKLPGSKRPRFTSLEMLHADQPGSECTVKLSGRALGAFLVAGPDAGTLEVSIDNGPFTTHDLFHHYSGGLHYPRTVMFNADLTSGEHVAKLRVSSQKNDKSKGTAVRLMQFAVN